MAEEDGGRELNETESDLAAKHRTDIARFEEEIILLSTDIESQEKSKDISELVRPDTRRQPHAHQRRQRAGRLPLVRGVRP